MIRRALVLIGLVIVMAGVGRELFANTSDCKRSVTRVRPDPDDPWTYTDGGCPDTECAGGAAEDDCNDLVISIGSEWWACLCGSSEQCTPKVFKPGGGQPTNANCHDTCSTSNCPGNWSGSQTQQVLNCYTCPL